MRAFRSRERDMPGSPAKFELPINPAELQRFREKLEAVASSLRPLPEVLEHDEGTALLDAADRAANAREQTPGSVSA
ncbi:MAG TPA: hypothetical protein VNZ53_24540 [Steroidobacteraceae bacterium]|jgi:hypothetical protein|nr:hypothetical protein [Steroidobacteraceae bacterium]